VAFVNLSGQPAVETRNAGRVTKTQKHEKHLLWPSRLPWLLLRGAAALATPVATLTAKNIDAAIQWGSWGEPPPAPYLLHNSNFDSGRPNPGVMGVVYTPFVRVALAAKIAKDAGRHFTGDDVDDRLIEPVVYVGMRWYCCVDEEHGTLGDWNPRRPPVDYKVATPVDRNFSPSGRFKQIHVTAHPLWVSYDLSTITPFGPLPYDDIVLVAAYPVSILSSNHDFVIYRTHVPTETSRWVSTSVVGRITPRDLVSWR
jgi:hypothetical protein